MEQHRIVCQICHDEGARSRVDEGGTRSTLMFVERFYDEDGVYHRHDPNRHSTDYECSRGHRWGVDRKTPCPAPGCGGVTRSAGAGRREGGHLAARKDGAPSSPTPPAPATTLHLVADPEPPSLGEAIAAYYGARP